MRVCSVFMHMLGGDGPRQPRSVCREGQVQWVEEGSMIPSSPPHPEALIQSPSSVLGPGSFASPGTGCPHSSRGVPTFPFPEI